MSEDALVQLTAQAAMHRPRFLAQILTEAVGFALFVLGGGYLWLKR